MTVDDKIRDEKLQNHINREAAKISVLSSGKIEKHEYLTGEEIVTSNRRQIIEQLIAEFNNLAEENFAVRLAQAKLSTKTDISDFIKKTVLMIN